MPWKFRAEIHRGISERPRKYISVGTSVSPTRRDLVERATRQDLVAATDAERRKETHYLDRAAGTTFVPFALETYNALSDRSDRFLVECATSASRECAGSGPSVSLLCTWFRQRVSIALQRSLVG